jgi:hypothetical protein
VQLGAGCLNVYLTTSGSVGSADVFIDLFGFYSGSPSGSVGLYNPLNTPFRALDTRTATGGHQARVRAGESFPLQVAGNSAIASSPVIPADASAITLNLTAVSGTADSFLSVSPAQSGSTPCPARATSSNLNFPASRTLANRVTVAIGNGGRICFFNSAGNVDVIADLAGWYSGGQAGDTTGLFFSAWTPVRIYDSRLTSPLAQGPGSCPGSNRDLAIPAAIGAASMNLTGLNASGSTYLSAFPTGSAPNPPTSDINYTLGDIQPNLVVTKLAGGSITICTAAAATDFFIDVGGVYRS